MAVESHSYGRRVELLEPSQVKAAAAVMAQAFFDDPFFTFTLPDPARRAHFLPWLFEKLIRYGQRYGRVYTTPSLAGVAMWLGPKQPRITLTRALRTGLFLVPLRLKMREFRYMTRLSDYADRLHERAVHGPHWYLYGIGVRSSHQRQGVGHMLLQNVLVEADKARLPCYLDTTNASNLPFYKRHGFSVVAHGQPIAEGPVIWAMRREPQ